MTKEEVEKIVEEKLGKQEVCPNCGRRPLCGKPYPIPNPTPYLPPTYPYPWEVWPNNTHPPGTYYYTTY